MKPYRISYVTETKFRDKYNATETKIVLTKRIAKFIESDNDLKSKIKTKLGKYKELELNKYDFADFVYLYKEPSTFKLVKIIIMSFYKNNDKNRRFEITQHQQNIANTVVKLIEANISAKSDIQ